LKTSYLGDLIAGLQTHTNYQNGNWAAIKTISNSKIVAFQTQTHQLIFVSISKSTISNKKNKLICSNCSHYHYLKEDCYWPRGGKTCQFLLNFYKEKCYNLGSSNRIKDDFLY